MGLKESAPLLHKIWPYALLAVGGGATLLGLVKALLKSRGDRSSHRQVRFTTGRPTDEDNYVFRDSGDLEGGDQEEIVEGEGEEGEEDADTPQVPYSLKRYPDHEMVARSAQFTQLMDTRRTVRMFSTDHVPFDVIRNVVKTAGTSPSGAHTEPWTYVVVSDPGVKKQIRTIIEDEEEVNYRRRMGEKWVSDLARLRTDWNKPYLEEAPHLVVVFKQTYGFTPSGRKKNHYYSEISTSISVGLFLAALTNVGLVTVTSTPMNAGPQLRTLLRRPVNEKVLVLLPVGYPANDCTVPQLYRKHIDNILVHI